MFFIYFVIQAFNYLVFEKGVRNVGFTINKREQKSLSDASERLGTELYITLFIPVGEEVLRAYL